MFGMLKFGSSGGVCVGIARVNRNLGSITSLSECLMGNDLLEEGPVPGYE